MEVKYVLSFNKTIVFNTSGEIRGYLFTNIW